MENIVRKGENACNKKMLPKAALNFRVELSLSSSNAFKLEKSKILSWVIVKD